MERLAVCAVGGNSLIRSPGRVSFADQYETAQGTARYLADMIQVGWRLIVTHGNGPQVGFLLIRSHLARSRLPEIPLDVCNALTQAEIGYMLQLALTNELRKRGLVHRVVTVVTQVLVDPLDPAFAHPSKPVGPFYTKREAVALERELGWVLSEDAGRGFRRLVPSPEPQAVLECREIEALVNAGVVVIAAGGGGIPVVQQDGKLYGVAAVIDKDLASGLLAQEIGAELLVISTSVEKVFVHYNQPEQDALDVLSVARARELLAQGQFPAGSMGPKIEAAIRFLTEGGHKVIITDPPHIIPALSGKAGTVLVV
ncbi:MAG: carbamate kinase [candidate division WOR-3 bacterium]